MPLLRKEVDTGSGTVQYQPQNYMTGVARAEMQQPDAGYTGASATESFLSGLLQTAPQIIDRVDKEAQAQGVFDASKRTDAAQHIEEDTNSQRWWLQDSYKRGYVNAATQQTVQDYNAKVTQLAQQGAKEGWGDQEYLQNVHEAQAQVAQSVNQYSEFMTPEFKTQIGLGLAGVNKAGYNTFLKTRLGLMKQKATTATYTSFGQVITQANQLDAANGEGSSFNAFNQVVNTLRANDVLTPQEQDGIIKDSVLAYAYAADSPAKVEAFSNYIIDKLGPKFAGSLSALHSLYQQKVSQIAPMRLIQSVDQANKVASIVDPQERQLAESALSSQLVKYVQDGTLTGEQYLSAMKQANPTSNPKAMLTNIVQGGGVTTIPLIQLSSSIGMAPSDVTSFVSNNLTPNSKNIQELLNTGRVKNDPESANAGYKLLGRAWEYTNQDLANTHLDENNQPVVSERVKDILNYTTSALRVADPLTARKILDEVPTQYKGAIQSVALTTDDTNENIYSKFMGYLDDEAAHPEPLQIPSPYNNSNNASTIYDTGAIRGKFTVLRWAGQSNITETSVKQDLHGILKQLQITNPDMLRTTPDKLNKIISNIWLQRHPVLTLPDTEGLMNTRIIGSFTASDMQKGVDPATQARISGTDLTLWNKALADTMTSVMKQKLGSTGEANLKQYKNRLGNAEFYASGDGSAYHIKFSNAEQLNASLQDITVSLSTINSIAKQYQKESMNKLNSEGAKLAHPIVITALDYNGGTGTHVWTIQGGSTNPNWKINPSVRNQAIANIAANEQLVTKRKSIGNGQSIIGYGRSTTSGKSIPDSVTPEEAQKMLIQDIDTEYGPRSSALINKYKLGNVNDSVLTNLMLDMSYEGWGKANKVAQTMGEFVKGNIPAEQVKKVYNTEFTDRNTQRAKMRNAWLQQWLDGYKPILVPLGWAATLPVGVRPDEIIGAN